MFSLLMGFGSSKDHIAEAIKKGHVGLTFTDLGNMMGSLDLYNVSKDSSFLSKINFNEKEFPTIIASEIYISDFPEFKDKNRKHNQITVFAKNFEGYKNLSYLVSRGSYPENFYRKPRVSLNELFKHKEGLVVTSGGIFGFLGISILKEYNNQDELENDEMFKELKEKLPKEILSDRNFPISNETIQYIKNNNQLNDEERNFIVRYLSKNYDKNSIIDKFIEEFGDDFYLELSCQRKDLVWSDLGKEHISLDYNPQEIVNKEFIKLSKEKNVKTILVQESFMPKMEDYTQQCIMIWNSPGNKGWYFPQAQYMMSVEEMYEVVQKNYDFIDDELFVESCQNSIEILNKCKDTKLTFRPSLPKIDYSKHYVNKVPVVIKRNLMLKMQELGIWNEENKLIIKKEYSLKNINAPESLKLEFNEKEKIIDFDNMSLREKENIELENILNEMENFYNDKEKDFYKLLKKSKKDIQTRTALKVIIKNKKLIPKNIDYDAVQKLIDVVGEKNPKVKGKKIADFKTEYILKISEEKNLFKQSDDKMDFLGNKIQRDRLVEELNTIQYNGIIKLITYFMLLEDISNFHKENDYLYGFGRGSGAGSIFAYGLDITDVDPLEYGLLFERFLTADRIGSIFMEHPSLKLKDFNQKIDLDVEEKIELLKSKFVKQDKDIKEFIENELFFVECNEEYLDYLLNLVEKKIDKVENSQNSSLFYCLGLSDQKPTKEINSSPTTLPDIDYDTMARDEVKQYLVNDFGIERVTLMGTFNSLKSKGAIKDVLRQLRPEMEFKDVNEFTKHFDELKATDYKNDEEFFQATKENVPEVKEFFEQNPDVLESVENILGNLKATGVHAGGIVVAGDDVARIVPCTFDNKKDFMLVTQPDMKYVEWAGLIKYDFLGLKTLNDFLKAFRLIEKRHGIRLSYSQIPKKDPKVYKKFTDGDTMSVFQFNKDWVKRILKDLKEIRSIEDLAIITSILRPGPMEMGMHHTFIKRVNGEEEIVYDHPSLEEILKDTYGIIVFQEQVMMTVRKLGGLSGSESVVVLKAMGKKQLDKLIKFKTKFIENAKKKYPDMANKVQFSDPEDPTKFIEVTLAEKIWLYLQAFAKYGFNKSHAVAYSTVSYMCMWLKHYYPIEWTTACMSGADKDDFKEFYAEWFNVIVKPDINNSKKEYSISKYDGIEKAIMPFSFINDVGDKAVDSIIECQPYVSFEDFYNRVDKRKVNKKCIVALILSGTFDSFNTEMKTFDFRKKLCYDFFKLRESDKKTSKKDQIENMNFLDELKNLSRGNMLIKEINLLNLTSFDYFTFYKQIMTEGAKKMFGQEAITPGEAKLRRVKSIVVVGGAIKDKRYFPIKKEGSRLFGKDIAKITLVNGDEQISVTVFPDQLERDMSGNNPIRDAEINTPIIIQAEVTSYNGEIGLTYKKGWTLN